MSIFQRIVSTEELKGLLVELLMNETSNVTKVSDGSVLSGELFGIAKLGNLALKDQAVIASRLYPDKAFGQYLDDYATLDGKPARFSSSGSSTYVRVVGDSGTVYTSGIHTFKGDNGITFDLDVTFSMPLMGFYYAKITSQTTGLQTNVDPNTINQVNPIPSGHQYVTNEYAAIGGRDIESDELFRRRVKSSANILARETTSMIEQVLYKLNPRILKVIHLGINDLGETVLGLLQTDGGDLSSPDLIDLQNKAEKFFTIAEYRRVDRDNNFIGIKFQNMTFNPIDISFRCQLDINANVDLTRKLIQINLNKYLDYRYFNKSRIPWTDLLEIIKRTKGVRYVPDNYFTPNIDLIIPFDQFPRIRGFIMMDLDGNIIKNLSGTLNPVFYPFAPDYLFQTSLLANI